MGRARLLLSLGVAASLPALCAGKCIAYEPGFADAGGADAVADFGDASVVPAVACSGPLEARLRATDLSFQIDCGCLETDGRTCTVAVGTTVSWRFADSESHNVTSLADAFGGSPDQLSGTFLHTFTEPGEYAYRCTLHSGMKGYSIVVVP